MYLTLIFLLSLLPLSLTSSPNTLTITYTPLSASAPLPLAHLTLLPHPTLASYTPPPASDPQALFRLGFSTAASSFSLSFSTPQSPTTLTTGSALNRPGGHFRVLLSSLDNSTISVSYQAAFPSSSTNALQQKQAGSQGEWPGVEIVYAQPTPQPVLNKPVVLNEEGKVEKMEPEKTFLQKYWWVLLAVAVLVMAGGGDK